MVRKGYTPERIISKLLEAEVLLSQGNTLGIVSKKIGITDQTAMISPPPIQSGLNFYQ